MHVHLFHVSFHTICDIPVIHHQMFVLAGIIVSSILTIGDFEFFDDTNMKLYSPQEEGFLYQKTRVRHVGFSFTDNWLSKIVVTQSQSKRKFPSIPKTALIYRDIEMTYFRIRSAIHETKTM